MKKLFNLFIMLFFITVVSANAEPFTKTLSGLNVNKGAMSVSIKKVKTGDNIYSLNDKTPRTPASTLKVLTMSSVVNTLGEDYVISTKLYKSSNNDLYLKLQGDPSLTSNDLEKLVEKAKEKAIAPKTFYIDDSIFDKVEWGEGWQWDDDLNPLIPKYSAYNINKNLVKVEVMPTMDNAPATIEVHPFYPITFMNLVTSDSTKSNDIKITRNLDIAPNMLNISGTVKKGYKTNLPVFSPKMNFVLRLEDAIKSKKLEYYNKIQVAQLPTKNVYLVEEVDHDLIPIVQKTLKDSDNLYAESLFKLAGSVYSKSQGTTENSLAMLSNYLAKKNISTGDIKIVDGSGVSKNNLITTDLMTQFLVTKSQDNDFDKFKDALPKPGEGTLSTRMLYFQDNLRAKTGTLSDVSAITGYLISKKGELYAFDIIIQDAKTTNADKKNIEEQILRTLYLNY